MTDEQTPADDMVDALDSAETSAEETYEQMRAERDEWRDKALRASAEAENVRRRTALESNNAKAYAIQRFASDLFQVADTLERALQAAPREAADPAVKNFVLGIEMTEKALRTAFDGNGMKRIEPSKGDKFDPHLHQAMMEQEDPEVEPAAVIQTMQAGYELFGRVVRPAMVVVAAKRAAAPAETQANPYGQPNGADNSGDSGGTVDTKA